MLEFQNEDEAIQHLSNHTNKKVIIAKYSGSRLHISPTKLTKVNSTSQDSKPFFKPNGFWYSCGSDWEDWISSEMPQRMVGYLYEISLGSGNMLFIDNVSKFEDFEKEYGVWSWEPQQGRVDITGPDSIKWKEVAQKYSGIEICPYVGSKRMHSNWYYPWDVASGCIWDGGVVKDIKLVREIEEIERDEY